MRARQTSRGTSRNCTTPPRNLLWLCLVLSAMMVVQASARVFWKSGAASKGFTTFATLGGHEVYRATITINGAEGQLRAFRFDQPLNRLTAQLRTRLQAEELAEDGTLRLATTTLEGMKLRLLVMEPTPGGPTVCFAILQTEAAFQRSQTPPRTPAGPITLPPGSAIQFTGSDKNSGFSATIATTGTDPESVYGYYARILDADAWTPPTARDRNAIPLPSGIRIFSRPGAICCVAALRTGEGLTQITLLHKTLGLK